MKRAHRIVSNAAAPADRAGDDRLRPDWFLRGCTWNDACWIFAPTSVLDEERPERVQWDFKLPSGRRFTDRSCRALLEFARRFAALVRTHSVSTGLPQRAGTVRNYTHKLRTLICWMDQEGFSRFDELDSAALLRFMRAIAGRRGRTGQSVRSTTLDLYARVLRYLYQYRTDLGDGLTIDPRAALRGAAGPRASKQQTHTSTPDIIAVPLVQQAIEFIATAAIDILLARERYIAVTQHHRRPARLDRVATVGALRARVIQTPRGSHRIATVAEFARLVDMLYAACFTVIAYLVGPRVSEILHLQSGCVRPRADGGDAVIAGAIFKLESGYHGRAHEWVAPPAAVHAIAVLEALSAPHRQRTGRAELWLRPHDRRGGAGEWLQQSSKLLSIPPTTRVNNQLVRFGEWLALPKHKGRRWRLTTHQGRKTFARFVALRDRTSLFALAQHLGHRDRSITDASYVGTDYALDQEIEAEVLEQSVSAWEYMLSTPSLGGRAGHEILAKRPRFRGASMKQDLRQYARMLVEVGLTLGICDWGYCVYRQEYSACRGTATAPSAERREPSTCARCKNFVVGSDHRPYWMEQAQRYEVLLREPALPTQTLKIARERLTEALAVIRSMDITKQSTS
jgi:integrase